MNPLDFINSPDTKKHLKDIKYNCKPIEAAWLIWQCRSVTVQEKHKAWKELISTSEDFTFDSGSKEGAESFHNLLKRYMWYENTCLDVFFKNENAAYTYDVPDSDNDAPYYSSFEAAFKDVDFHVRRIKFIREAIDGSREIVVIMDEHQNIYECWANKLLEDKMESISHLFEDKMWFDFPLPFKPGDVVCDYREDGGYDIGYCKGPFVFLEKADKGTDCMDMLGIGYFVDENGKAYCECMHNNMNLCYFRGELPESHQILKSISQYHKGEVDLLDFAYQYHKKMHK